MDNAVPRSIHWSRRHDIVNDICVAVLEGTLNLEDIKDGCRAFIDTPSVVVTAPNPAPGLSPPITCQSRRVGGMVQTTC